MSNPSKVSSHYDESYFERQLPIGEFGAWANQTKFIKYITENDDVLDFGCGSGLLLKGIKCKRKIGVEINPAAMEFARMNGVEVYQDVDDIPDECVDVIISNNVLEHTLRPLDELKSLYKKLKYGGKIIFVVPCDSISFKYKPNDVNHHLYSWSPMNLGNMFIEAGFSVVESKAYIHKWPLKWRLIAKFRNRPLFELLCRISGVFRRSWFQVRAIGVKQAR